MSSGVVVGFLAPWRPSRTPRWTKASMRCVSAAVPIHSVIIS